MKPLDATLRTAGAVAALALSGALSGCYYYAPYGYYPGYGYYPAYPVVPTSATQQEYPVTPGDSVQPSAQAQFSMPADSAYTNAPPGYGTATAYAAPAYYPVAYPAYPYGYPYYGYPYGWAGWWGPSISLSFGYWGGCCGGHYGYWGHHGYWGGHGHWGGGHGRSH